MKKSIGAEVLQHALHGESVDSEGDAESTEVQTTAHHIVVFQQVREGRVHPAAHEA